MKFILLTTSILFILNLNAQTVIKYDETNSPLDMGASCLIVDSKGNIWVGNHKFDGSEWITVGTDGGLLSFWINVVFEDSKGVIWFGTGEGISKFDGTNWENITSDDGLPDYPIYDIVEDKDGIMWIGTDKGGVAKIAGNNITVYSEENGFPSNRIRCIAVDSENTKWFGTYAGVNQCGLIELNDDGWKSYTMEDGLPTLFINDIAVDSNNNVWIGTDYKGVLMFDGTTFKNYTMKDGLTSDGVYGVGIDTNDNIWFGTHRLGGTTVCMFDGHNWTKYPIYESIDNIAVDSKGNVWASNRGSLYKIDFKTTAIHADKIKAKVFSYDCVFDNISVDIQNLKSIKIYDLHGKLVLTERQKTTSVLSLHDGLYIICAENNEGRKYIDKFIK